MKKLMTIAAVGLAALALKAGTSDMYFYWKVASAENEFSYAKLAYSIADGERGYFTIGDTPAKAVLAADGGRTTEGVFANFGATDWSDYAFAVETYNLESAMVGRSASMKYDDIKDFIYGAGGAAGGSDAMMNPGDPFGFNVKSSVIPEPTSGLLVLVGLVGLALKRKTA